MAGQFFQKVIEALNPTPRKGVAPYLAEGRTPPFLDERVKQAAPDPSRDPAERKELAASTGRLRAYRLKKKISGDTDAEARLAKLQSQPSSYKKGTKKVPKTGVAKLHKGEAVLNKKQAKKFRTVKGSAGLLGAGKSKAKKAKHG